METLKIIQGGFECGGCVTADGWIASVTCLRNVDAEFIAELNRETVTFKANKTEQDWSSALETASRELRLVVCSHGKDAIRTISSASRIRQPALAGGTEPAIAWSERQNDKWRIMLWRPGKVDPILEQDVALGATSIVLLGEQPIIACEQHGNGTPAVHVLDSDGQFASVPGRRPFLLAVGHERILLFVETVHGPRKVDHILYSIKNRELEGPLTVPVVDDYDFGLHATMGRDNREVLLTRESCPSWGIDEHVGLHRQVSLWVLDLKEMSFKPGPGTVEGTLYLGHEAFIDATPHNFATIRPRVICLPQGPAISFRRFRFTGFKGFGWDTFLTRYEGGRRTRPARVSEHDGPPDAGYAVANQGNELIGFFPCCDQRRGQSFEEEAAGMPPKGRTWFAENHRVEIVRFSPRESLKPLPLPTWKRAPYVIPPPFETPAPAPPRLDEAPPGLSLVWADLHAHTAYSKCMSANDGLPQDVLRFQRDVLGCRVLCLTEHVEYMTSPEFPHVLDAVEAEATHPCIPLYGVEWAKKPAHHTNLFALDRAVFDKLRALMLTCDHLTSLYERIKSELPARAVVAIRHMHGRDEDEFGVSGPRVSETHDPAVEWAMEAMQTRGNMMIAPPKNIPCFPSNFLDADAKVGLVGGSDHSRGAGPNRFCLTGLWVQNESPAAIFEALRNRRTIACSNGKVAIWATVEGKPMGEQIVTSSALRVSCSISSETKIIRAALMRDGQFLEWHEVAAPKPSIVLVDPQPPPGQHWYSVTVEAESTFVKPRVIAHASPFFVNVQ